MDVSRMKFVNRDSELSLLNDIYNQDKSQMMVLYGRRRIGKTTLITHWLNNYIENRSIYWVAHKSSSEMLLEKFSKVVKPCLKDIDYDAKLN